MICKSSKCYFLVAVCWPLLPPHGKHSVCRLGGLCFEYLRLTANGYLRQSFHSFRENLPFPPTVLVRLCTDDEGRLEVEALSLSLELHEAHLLHLVNQFFWPFLQTLFINVYIFNFAKRFWVNCIITPLKCYIHPTAEGVNTINMPFEYFKEKNHFLRNFFCFRFRYCFVFDNYFSFQWSYEQHFMCIVMDNRGKVFGFLGS